MKSEKVKVEEVELTGDKLLGAVKEIVRQGNVRRIGIRNAKGEMLLEIPLFLGVAGAALVPVWVAVGALAALAAKWTIVVERVDEVRLDDVETPAETAEKAEEPGPRTKKAPKRR